MDPQAEHTTHPEIQEQDPTHDIDGKTTWTWLIGCTVGVFLIVGILDQVFHAVVFNQRVKVIEMLPTTQLDELRGQETQALSAGEGRVSLDDAITTYLKNKNK
jgi:hypothetical protein